MINQVSAEELKTQLSKNKNLILIDVRNDWEHKIVNFKEAILIPLSTLNQKLDSLDKEKEYIIHCHTGVRSMNACLLMKMKGFNNISNLKGGIAAFSEINKEFKKY
ncbi:MAG: rhodanese-like domain-containing protein [Bacteroidetes bacterium]|nr:rhodanese-like domain-containing protein [Bacteroidota bacterium]